MGKEAKEAAITVRIPGSLKRRLEATARRDRRSLSAQIAIYLEREIEGEPAIGIAGKLLGVYEGGRVPTEGDFAEARELLWSRLGKAGGKHRGA